MGKYMNNKHKIEAESIGLTLISEEPLNNNGTLDFNYKLYRFNSCSHDQYLQVTHVRRNNVKCKVCFEQDIIDSAKIKGFTVVGSGVNALFRKVKKDSCGHLSEIRHTAFKKHNTPETDYCPQCYDIKLAKDAEAADMTYLGKALSNNGVFRHYMFNKCGHTRDIQAPCITYGNFSCSECKENRYKDLAAIHGLKYVGFCSNRSDCKRKYILPCGHTKEIRMDHASGGSYMCDICGDSHYTKPSSIYLLKMKASDGFSWLKLGFAKDLATRQSSYGLGKHCSVETIMVVDVPSGAFAVSKEKSWHRLLKQYRLDSKLMKKYHKFNGFTECYILDVESTITQLMLNLVKEINE
jgi:hypothetical protein